MKILKYLLFLILSLVVIFIAKGLLTPEVSYDNTVVVNKSAKEAWAVMSDDANLPKWIKGYKRNELVSGDGMSVGSVSNVYVEENGKEMMMKETVTAVKPYEQLAMNFTMDFMEMDYEMLFDEENGKTTIVSKSKTRGNGLIAKSMISFMPAGMEKQEQENLNSLKKLIDENTKNYFPAAVIDTSSVIMD